MGHEDVFQAAWHAYVRGEPLPAIGLGEATSGSIGPGQRGSNNIGPGLCAAALLERSLRPEPPADTRQIIDHALEIFRLQREFGIGGRDTGLAYAHFHEGTATTFAIVAQNPGDAMDMISELALWSASEAWWADHLALLRGLRCPDGHLLAVGSRTPPHQPRPYKGIVPLLACQILDPLPSHQLAPWIAALCPPGLSEANLPTATPREVRWGWHKPANAPDVDILRLLLRALATGALDAEEIRRRAVGRKPLVAAEIVRWRTGDDHYAGALSLTGIPQRCWVSRWRAGKCDTLVYEAKGELVGKGSGWHRAPDEALRLIPDRAELVVTSIRWDGDETEPPPARKPKKPPKPKEKPMPKKPKPDPPPADDRYGAYREQLLSAVKRWGLPGGPSTADLLGLLNKAAQKGLE